jgi:glycosyltransferase involved in cell wall biosynthesis
MRAGKKLGIPVVVGSIGSDLNSIADAATLYFTSITLRKADFVVTKSEHLRSQAILRGAAPEKVRVVPNGCDTSIFFVRERSAVRREMGVDQNDALIVYVGRLAESKGLCEALEALTMLHKTRLNVRMVLIGQGSFEETMRRRASALRISDRLIFTGAQDAQQIARWLGAADVFTLPSYAEGCPNVVIEALSSGRPVVATNVGGIPEIVDERCSILVPPRDAGALANALEIALSRNWDERAIASHFRRPWDDVAAELLEISTDLCRKNRDSWVPEKSPVKLFKS